MQSKRYMRYTSSNIDATILMSTSIPPKLHSLVLAKCRNHFISINDVMRIALDKWIDEGCPVQQVQMERFKYHIGAYVTEELYLRIRNVAQRRGISMSQCLRQAIAYSLIAE